jgi:uncharacterized DUF497 family protein
MKTSNSLTYEWDKQKEIANMRKHGVSFHEASTVFLDELSITFYDPDHSGDGDRCAREATKKEREGYEKAN